MALAPAKQGRVIEVLSSSQTSYAKPAECGRADGRILATSYWKVQEKQKVVPPETGHYRGQHAIALFRRFSGNVEEKLEHWAFLKAARQVHT